jgi:hypothetical protein
MAAGQDAKGNKWPRASEVGTAASHSPVAKGQVMIALRQGTARRGQRKARYSTKPMQVQAEPACESPDGSQRLPEVAIGCLSISAG